MRSRVFLLSLDFIAVGALALTSVGTGSGLNIQQIVLEPGRSAAAKTKELKYAARVVGGSSFHWMQWGLEIRWITKYMLKRKTYYGRIVSCRRR
jgi:hypothetical protein